MSKMYHSMLYFFIIVPAIVIFRVRKKPVLLPKIDDNDISIIPMVKKRKLQNLSKIIPIMERLLLRQSISPKKQLSKSQNKPSDEIYTIF